MSVSCTSSPTFTQTSQVVTQRVETTSTDSVTTTPPTTTTIVTASCVPTLPIGSCVTTSITSISVIPAVTATVQVPLTLTVPITSNAVNTFFGSSCTTISTGSITTPPTQVTTPSPTVITSESTSTQDNGSVIVQTLTTTATQSPISVPTTVQHSNNNNDIGATPIAPIIGGVVGGFFGLIGIVALIWFILKRRRRWDDIFEKEDHDLAAPGRNSRFSLDADMGPKPYQYGLVGHALPPDPVTPPHSPPLLPMLHTNADPYSPQSRHERHRSSLPPLNLAATTSTPGPSATTSSRPSTGGSTQPLRPPSQQGLQQQQQRPADFRRSISGTAPSQFHQQGTTSYLNRNSSPDHGTGYGAGASTIGMAVLGGYDQPSYPNRTGSPASVVELPPRRLTIANATSPESTTFPANDSLVTLPAVGVTDGNGRLRTIPPKAPIIHLDGGRVQERIMGPHDAGGSSSLAGPFPPAYEA